jgi:membrane-bound metal-dependent hydrolase YbcI (DUF457 family)
VLGRSHALSGVVTGLAAGSLILHEHPAPLLLLTGLTAAYVLGNDLDSCGSTEARSFGFVTWCLAWCIRAVSGGHRHGTHSLAGIAAFTAVAWLACLFRHTWPGRTALFVILAVGLAAAVDALTPRAAHAGNVLALAGAAAMCWTGYGLALVPLAAATGAATHIIGDCLTRSGCPLLWPATMREFHLTPRPLRFTTGKLAEHVIVTPLLLAALAFLLWHDTGALALTHHIHTGLTARSNP